MQWLTRYRLRNYLKRSAWVAPTLAIPAATLAFPLVRWLDARTAWRLLDFTPDGARALLGAVAPTTLTLTVLILSTTLLAVQLASSQFSPRLIAGLLANRPIRFCLSAFIFSYVFCVGALGRVEGRVPQLLLLVSIALTLVCVAAAFYLVDFMAKELRPVQMLARTAGAGRRVIEQVYPQLVSGDPATDDPPPSSGAALSGPHETIAHARRSGVMLAIDVPGLIELARAADRTIELVPRVGDFVARDDPLFRVYPAGGTGAGAPDDFAARLQSSVAFGNERTPEQDPVFVFRILVDVACKALSPAVNDPTTAVLAIDQIHHLLRQVGKRRLDTGATRDATGRLRLVYHTPDWHDFVLVAITETRQFGAGSIQVARRLGAMLENLAGTVSPGRAALLKEQLTLLHRAVERSFEDPEDRVAARTPDYQGVGGSRDDAPKPPPPSFAATASVSPAPPSPADGEFSVTGRLPHL